MSKRVHYSKNIARTGTGDPYDQSHAILNARDNARRLNPNAVVLNPHLAAGPSVLYNGQRDYNYTTNDPTMYQTSDERNANRIQQMSELTDQERIRRQNSRFANQATLARVQAARNASNNYSGYEYDSSNQDSSNQDCDQGNQSGCNVMGGKVAKKTKRKRSRRTKKSRRHRKK
jgi:hypothetical protein